MLLSITVYCLSVNPLTESCVLRQVLDGGKKKKGYNTKIDIKFTLDDTSCDFAERYKVTTLPTLIKLDDKDNEIARLTGLVSLNRIKEFFEVE